MRMLLGVMIVLLLIVSTSSILLASGNEDDDHGCKIYTATINLTYTERPTSREFLFTKNTAIIQFTRDQLLVAENIIANITFNGVLSGNITGDIEGNVTIYHNTLLIINGTYSGLGYTVGRFEYEDPNGTIVGVILADNTYFGILDGYLFSTNATGVYESMYVVGVFSATHWDLNDDGFWETVNGTLTFKLYEKKYTMLNITIDTEWYPGPINILNVSKGDRIVQFTRPDVIAPEDQNATFEGIGLHNGTVSGDLEGVIELHYNTLNLVPQAEGWSVGNFTFITNEHVLKGLLAVDNWDAVWEGVEEVEKNYTAYGYVITLNINCAKYFGIINATLYPKNNTAHIEGMLIPLKCTVLKYRPPPPTPPPGVISAYVKICPRTLNLKSKGRWITCLIELPKPYKANDINVSTIVLRYDGFELPAEKFPIGGKDRKLMVKFDRQKLISFFKEEGILGNVTLTVTGKLYNGALFEGSDTIRVICPGKAPSNKCCDKNVSYSHGKYKGSHEDTWKDKRMKGLENRVGKGHGPKCKDDKEKKKGKE